MFKATDDISQLVLIEIGPRFVMNPIKSFEGSMGGEALWQNEKYVGPSKIRSKKYESFHRKRTDKQLAKHYKDAVEKEGKDPDGYLDAAFDDESD